MPLVLAPIVLLCLSNSNRNNNNSKKRLIEDKPNDSNSEEDNTHLPEQEEQGRQDQDTNKENSNMDIAIMTEVNTTGQKAHNTRMSTFLTNMETIGEVCVANPMHRFGRNVHTIRHSLLQRTNSVLVLSRDTSGRDTIMSKDRSGSDSHSHDGSESTSDPSFDDYSYYQPQAEEPDLLSCTCHGDEVIRRRPTSRENYNFLAAHSHVSQQAQRPSFLEARLEMFVSNIDTIAEVVRERGSLGIRPQHDDDDDEEISKSIHLTL